MLSLPWFIILWHVYLELENDIMATIYYHQIYLVCYCFILLKITKYLDK